jgi:hypothetical protein
MSVSLTKSYSEQVTITILSMTRQNGIAGQFAITATVRYSFPDAPDQTTVTTFVGSAYGGTPVMVLSNGSQHHVTDAGRFGEFSTEPREWVRRFYA